MTQPSPSNAEGASGSGAHSLAGYEYQIGVSVWLALDLVLVSRRAREIVLEPASEEDLEAQIGDSEPGPIVSRVPIGDYLLIVQAKRRTADAWNVTSLRNLLKHGSETRLSAIKRLQNKDARYLLVTSAAVNNRDARELVVRRADVWPKGKSIPASIATLLPADAPGRLAVIANEDDERLWSDIDRLLLEGCRVPRSRLDNCRDMLGREARKRVLGAQGGRWRREELEAIIHAHDGFLASAPELENYVHPTNWGDLKAAIRDRHAAVIVGKSGTGKTLATKQLYEELREEFPGLTRVSISKGPGELQSDRTVSPVIYDIEDPWGRFDFDPDSRPWNDQLQHFLAGAREDRMIVMTSRLDVAQASAALESVKPWVVALESEHYGPRERSRLYRTRIASLARELQPLAQGAERDVLGQLETPLEIQKFFDALRTRDRGGLKNSPGLIADAIAQSHQEAIENTVLNQIEAREDVAAAAVLWGLLKASDKIARPLVREIEDGLSDHGAIDDRGISPLIDFFIAARNFRQSDAGLISYYHPRVEKGIEETLRRHRPLTRRALAALADLLTATDGPDPEWGSAAAARMIAASNSHFKIRPSAAAAAAIDGSIAKLVSDPDRPLRETLSLAADAGSAQSNPSEIARFLLHRPDRSFGGFQSWAPPKHPEAWYEIRRADEGTKPLIERFIREVLPTERDDYSADLSAELAKLATGLTPAFLDAAKRVVSWGYIPTDEVIAAGALDDLGGFEEIVDLAVEELTLKPSDTARNAEIHLDIINRVYSDDYAQHIGERDDGHTAQEFLSSYVTRLRQTNCWKIIAEHRHIAKLAYYWFRQLDGDHRPDPEEFAAAFAHGFGTEDEHWLWSALLKHWDPKYSGPLARRIIDGSADGKADFDAMAVILMHEFALFEHVIAKLSEQGAANRLAEIAIVLASMRRRSSRDDPALAEAAERASAVLPGEFASLSDAKVALDGKTAPTIGAAARDALTTIADPSEDVRVLRLELDAVISMRIEEDVRWVLANSEEVDHAHLAVKCAIRHQMKAEIESALGHRFADVVAEALKAIADPLAAPLPEHLLDLSTNRGSPVRAALVEILKAKRHAAHRPTLMLLAGDQWSRDSGFYGEDDHFPIARTAVDALTDLAPLPKAEAQKLFEIGTGSRDQDLRLAIFTLLGRTGGDEMQSQLFDLAVQPGSPAVRMAAADALLRSSRAITEAVLDKITPGIIAQKAARIAAPLTLLAGDRLETKKVRLLAHFLHEKTNRPSLILLLAFALKNRDFEAAKQITDLLPAEHPAVAWALGGAIEQPDEALLADLGDAVTCRQVLAYMVPTSKKRGG